MILAAMRRPIATWGVVVGYAWFAFGLFALRFLIDYAFFAAIVPSDTSRSDLLLRWHPAALYWFAWTAVAIVFAILDRRRGIVEA
jgi:hypothetical protein